jgi:hypothetical protein
MWLLAGCQPASGPPLSLVTAPRVLALRGQPAEVAPGAMVTWDALVASPDGELAAALDWSICPSPRPLTTNDVVSPACLSQAAIAHAPSLSATVPADACQLFGPETPPSVPGQPDPRPVAADTSGGWYQPYRADLGAAQNIGLQRIRCNLLGASADVAAQFRMQYTANLDPQPNPIQLGGADADGQTITAGAQVTLTAGWPAESAERYPVFDVASQTLAQHREAMRVSWFATAGEFADERTGRAGDDLALDSDNRFLAPAGPVHVWAVLRDDRGGVGWTHARLDVRDP